MYATPGSGLGRVRIQAQRKAEQDRAKAEQAKAVHNAEVIRKMATRKGE